MRKNLRFCLSVLLLIMGSLQGFALTQDANGVYQIATLDDLLDFSDIVNNGTNPAACGVLTADIDASGEDYYPIGVVEHPYKGTFDGQGHTIQNLYIDSDVLGYDEYLGVFGVLAGGATIKNLFVGGGDEAFIGGTRFVGGIAGGTNGTGVVTIENCGNEAWIYSTEENAAGILGVDMSSAATIIIHNCYNMGKIQGGRECGAICGWAGDHGDIKNCWNTGSVEGRDESRPFCRFNGAEFEGCYDVQGVQANIGTITEEELAGMTTGEFCYRVLNQTLSEDVAWYQTIGTDEHPYPIASHGIVYAVGDLYCDGTSKSGATTYSNSNTSNRDPHNFVDGACSRCNEFDPDYLTADAEGYYNLAKSADLYWFARFVNQKGNNAANARLTADIVYEKQERLGVEQMYSGVFDGQEHKITINFTNTDVEFPCLFAVVEDATIENLTIAGNVEATNHYAAGIVGHTYGNTVIKNCIAAVDIVDLYDGDGTHGGICAIGESTLVIENCGFVGTLYAPYSTGSGGIMGYTHGGQSTHIKNCYVAGQLTLKEGDNNIQICRNNPYIENCWVSSVNYKYESNEYTSNFDPEAIETGELCYQDLNGTETSNPAWYQTLGTDAYPVPFATHGTVYVAGAQNCDGTPKEGAADGYSNDPSGNRDAHDFADGFCTKCGSVDPTYLTADADGFFSISNDKELYWFAKYTKTQDTKNANARLTDDINYSHQEKIGADRVFYGGTFDGQEHSITLALEGESRVALFDLIDNATIENLVIKGNIDNSGQFAGGLVCESYGTTTIKNVVVAADITSSYEGDGTHGGICAIGHDALTIENCAFVGSLTAELSTGSGGIMGYTHDASNTTIRNCYVSAEMSLVEGDNNITICRNDPFVENCYASWDLSYYNNNDGVEFFDNDKELCKGELCYNLNGDQSAISWYQALNRDPYPVPFASHLVVYAHGEMTCAGKPVDTITYSNEPGSITVQPHEFVDGLCKNCNNAYQLATGDDLVNFSYDVQSGTANTAYAELTADIDLSGYDYLAIGGRSDEGGVPFAGVFDGKGHKISNMVISNELNNQGLFGVVADGAEIRNVVVDNTCSVSCKGYAAGIIGATVGTGKIVIEQCGNEANITVVEANAAGILGVDDLGQMTVVMNNCYNTGVITGQRESAAMTGWLSAHSSVSNSWNTGEITGLDGTNTFLRSDNGKAKIINCYETIGNQATTCTTDDVTSGVLCYNLNGGKTENIVWFQTVGQDAHPVFDSTHDIIYNGVEKIASDVETSTEIYTINGMKVQTLQKGINIIRMSNGTVRKVLVK